MSKSRKRKPIKLITKTTKSNKIKLTNPIKPINTNLLVSNDSFKTYGIPQLEKWMKILNPNETNIKTDNKLTKPNKTKTTKKRHSKKRNKLTKRKDYKKFFGIF